MAKHSSLGDLRAALESTILEIIEERSDGVAPNDLILSRLKEDRSALIETCRSELIDMALTKVLNQVCNLRRSSARIDGQPDLFSGMSGIPRRITIARLHKKDIADLKVSEARQWLHEHSARTEVTSTDRLKGLLQRCVQNAELEDETISQVMVRLRTSAHEKTRELELAP